MFMIVPRMVMMRLAVIKFAGHRTELAMRQPCAPWAKCSASQQGGHRVAERPHSGLGGASRLGQPACDDGLDDLQVRLDLWFRAAA